MPVLIIYGMPSDGIEERHLSRLIQDLQNHTASVLGIPVQSVSVFIPKDCASQGIGEELICFVEGLFKKPERTREVRAKLAAAIKLALEGFADALVPMCKLVEVFVKQFDPDKDCFDSAQIT